MVIAVDYDKLSDRDREIANLVFVAKSKHNFATGIYERSPKVVDNRLFVDSSTAATTTFSYSYHVDYKSVNCVANVPGLDQEAFIDAVTEFMKLSRKATFDAINIDNEVEDDSV